MVPGSSHYNVAFADGSIGRLPRSPRDPIRFKREFRKLIGLREGETPTENIE